MYSPYQIRSSESQHKLVIMALNLESLPLREVWVFYLASLSQLCSYSLSPPTPSYDHLSFFSYCSLKDELFLHFIRDCIDSRNLWLNLSFLIYFLTLDCNVCLKTGSYDNCSDLFVARILWSWINIYLTWISRESIPMYCLSLVPSSIYESLRTYFSNPNLTTQKTILSM